jgi:hypothetical protein
MMILAPVTNWEPQSVTLARYCYAMRHGMKVHIITPYRASRNVTALRYAVKLQVCTHVECSCSRYYRTNYFGEVVGRAGKLTEFLSIFVAVRLRT